MDDPKESEIESIEREKAQAFELTTSSPTELDLLPETGINLISAPKFLKLFQTIMSFLIRPLSTRGQVVKSLIMEQ